MGEFEQESPSLQLPESGFPMSDLGFNKTPPTIRDSLFESFWSTLQISTTPERKTHKRCPNLEANSVITPDKYHTSSNKRQPKTKVLFTGPGFDGRSSIQENYFPTTPQNNKIKIKTTPIQENYFSNTPQNNKLKITTTSTGNSTVNELKGELITKNGSTSLGLLTLPGEEERKQRRKKR